MTPTVAMHVRTEPYVGVVPYTALGARANGTLCVGVVPYMALGDPVSVPALREPWFVLTMGDSPLARVAGLSAQRPGELAGALGFRTPCSEPLTAPLRNNVRGTRGITWYRSVWSTTFLGAQPLHHLLPATRLALRPMPTAQVERQSALTAQWRRARRRPARIRFMN